MRTSHLTQKKRAGAMAPLVAILMILFLAMVAFAVDIGYITSVQAELQNTADSAALAGASQLMLPQIGGNGVNTNAQASVAVPGATTQAQNFASYNHAGSKSISLAGSDVVVGYQANINSSLTPWASGGTYPNTVQVTVRRDNTSNGPLPLFFGPVLGVSNWTGTATATATVNTSKYPVSGFYSATGGKNGLLLPIAVDLNFWNTFVATGKSPDGQIHDNFTYNSSSSAQAPPNNVSSGSDGIPELTDVYPNNTSPGNFGLLNLNYTNPVNDTPSFRDWILNGPTPSDLQSFGSNGFQASTTSGVTVKGGPGMKSTLITDFASIVGQARVVPLFSSYSGNGSNTYYTIVGFAGVTIVSATGHGSNSTLSFQPAVVIDQTATYSTSSSGSGSAQFVYPAVPIELTK